MKVKYIRVFFHTKLWTISYYTYTLSQKLLLCIFCCIIMRRWYVTIIFKFVFTQLTLLSCLIYIKSEYMNVWLVIFFAAILMHSMTVYSIDISHCLTCTNYNGLTIISRAGFALQNFGAAEYNMLPLLVIIKCCCVIIRQCSL